MAYNEVKHHDFAAEFMRLVDEGDFCGAGHFLRGINEQDKKMIAAKEQEVNAMLFIAATSGNKDMVEFLVKYCRTNIEEGGRLHKYHSVTPLWCAAANGRLEVVEHLQKHDADINAVSNTGITSISYACDRRRKETVEFLIKQGADIHRPNDRGETCLMKSVGYSKLCKFLIDNGARVNDQDNLGNTALHHAITEGRLKTVELLLDRGSDQNIKNKLGDDALQLASLHGRELVVKELEVRQKPTPSRRIDSLQLLGSYFLFSTAADNVGRALVSWRRSVKLRIRNPRAELCKVESMPVYMIVKEVNTVEELEVLCQEEEMVHMYAIQNLLRILGPGHKETTYGLAIVSKVYFRNRKYRRCFDLLKYAFQRLQDCCSPTFCEEYLLLLQILRMTDSDEFQIEFDVVFEILDMVTSKVQFLFLLNSSTTKIDISSIMHSILFIIFFVVKLDKSPEQRDIFKQAIHRLVHSQVRDKYGQTFLHHAVQKWFNYPVVAKVLLECGADVNAVDSRHNTALHLISSLNKFSKRYPIPESGRSSEIVQLLLQYSAHPDIVNYHGFFPARDLSLNMLDHVSLKCLATAVIRDHQIPYTGGQIPQTLVSFVQMHGRCPSVDFQYPFPPRKKTRCSSE